MAARELGWVVALLASLTAGVVVWWARAQRNGRSVLEGQLGGVRAQLSDAQAQLAKRSRALAERRKELGELRRRLDKTRRRAFDARESTGSLEERVQELQRGLSRREQQARQAAMVLESAREQLSSREQEIARLHEQLATARPRSDPEEQARGSQRVATLEAELSDLTRKLRDAERETARYRSRERTHRRLYLVIRGELEIARDRLAALGVTAGESRPAVTHGESAPEVGNPGQARPTPP